MTLRRPSALLLAAFVIALLGCTGDHHSPFSLGLNRGRNFQPSSPVFSSNGPIPAEYTCDGANVSPPLGWSGAPAATRSFAVITSDPDAPSGAFTHWVLYNLPAGTTGLPGAIPAREQLPGGAAQGRNDFGAVGYGGPCPPPGSSHHYEFRIYALDSLISFGGVPRAQEVILAMEHHILADARLVGTYSRPAQ